MANEPLFTIEAFKLPGDQFAAKIDMMDAPVEVAVTMLLDIVEMIQDKHREAVSDAN